MKIEAIKTTLAEIEPLRTLFLQENDFQIRYNACHERGWSDPWLMLLDGRKIGYGAIKGQEGLGDRDAVFEFFLLPDFRKMAGLVFAEWLAASGAAFIECQSNDVFLTGLLYQFSRNIRSEVALFEDHLATDLVLPDAVFRPRRVGEPVFEHHLEPVGAYVLEMEGAVVATGGFMLHYNPPFADLYLEMKEDHRRSGLGSFLLQELKKECYRSGRVPAARCNIRNVASKAALAKAGLRVCGFMMEGEVVRD